MLRTVTFCAARDSTTSGLLRACRRAMRTMPGRNDDTRDSSGRWTATTTSDSITAACASAISAPADSYSPSVKFARPPAPDSMLN